MVSHGSYCCADGCAVNIRDHVPYFKVPKDLLRLWDDDTIQEDEPLGRTKVAVSKLVERKKADIWLKLQHVKHGQIQLRTTWLTLSDTPDDLEKALYEIKLLQVSSLSSAILTVYVNSGSDLMKESSKRMDIYVRMKIGNQDKRTHEYKKLADPVWEEGFVFLVQNPEEDEILFSVIDDKKEEVVGELVYTISTLLGKANLRIEKDTFRLSKCETEGKINLSMSLRILKNYCFDGEDSQSSSDENIAVSRSENLQELSECSSLSRSSSTSSDSTDSSKSTTKSDILSPAKIKLTLRYSVQRQTLIVVIHHVEDLHFDETTGLYVKLYLLPERHKDTKRKTQVIRTSKNPVFDETFEFIISQDELSQKHLEVSVCEERVIKNEVIEKVVIDLDKLSLVLPHTRLFRLFKKSHES